MQMGKRLGALFAAICIIFAVNTDIYAHEVPDASREGSVSVAMTYDGTAVAGGTLTLYQAGKVCEDDGSYGFALTEAFAKSGVSLDNPESSELAESLAAYVSVNEITASRTVKIGDDGRAVAADLELGLYLVVQSEAAAGYKAVEPFLVSVPMYENGTYIYDVDASPKLSILTKEVPVPTEPVTPTKPATPTKPGTPGKTTVPSTPARTTLPQTGQLNWPVPVLAVLGLCLFLLGWGMRFGKKETSYEA